MTGGAFELSATLTFWGGSMPACFDAATGVVVSVSCSRVCILDPSAGCVSLWKVEGEGSCMVRPVTLALSPCDGRSRIMHCAVTAHREREALGCIAEDGSFLLLSLHDGSYLNAAPGLLHQAISACSLPAVFGSSLLAVGGAHCQLSIVDCDSLTVLCSAEVPPPGFTSAIAAQALPQRPGEPASCTLVAVMADRVLRYWVVHGGDSIVLEARRTTPLAQRGVPMGVDLHPLLPLVLVVVSDGWGVHLIHAPHPIAAEGPPAADEVLACGCFLPQRDPASPVRVALFSSSGRAWVFELPEAACREARGEAALATPDTPASLPGAPPPPLLVQERAVPAASVVVWSVSPWEDGRQWIAGIARGGRVVLLEAVAGGSPALRFAAEVQADADWARCRGAATPPGTPGAPGRDGAGGACSLLDVSGPLSTHAPVMIRAHHDGSVAVVEVGGRREQTRWTAHGGSGVQHLLAVPGPGGRRALVTAAADGGVSLWGWGSWSLLASFHLHSRAVARLFAAPEGVAERYGVVFGSVGMDGNVVLYDSTRAEVHLCLRGQGADAAPSALYFLDDVDCAAVAAADSRDVHIWHLGTGQLVRVLRGKIASSLLSRLRDSETNYALPPPLPRGGAAPAEAPPLGGSPRGKAARPQHQQHQHQQQASSPTSAPSAITRVFGAAPAPARAASQPRGAGGERGGSFLHTFASAVGRRMEMADSFAEKAAPAAPVQTPSLVIDIPTLIRHLHSLAPKPPSAVPQDGKSPATPSPPQPPPPARLPPSVSAVVAYLLQDETHKSVADLREAMQLDSTPHPAAAVGFATPVSGPRAGQLGVVLLPVSAPGSGPWGCSPVATARRLTALLALLYALISADPVRLKPLCKAAINYYATTLPQQLLQSATAHEADFFWCLETLKEPMKDVQFAARCVLNGVLRHRRPAQLQALTQRLFRTARSPSASLEDVHVAFLGVAITTVQCPETVKEGSQTAQAACQGLLSITTAKTSAVNTTLMVTALTLLSDSYEVWAPLVPSPIELIKLLFQISTSSDADAAGTAQEELPNAANRTLLTVGAAHLSTFFAFADQVLGDTSMASQVASPAGRSDGSPQGAQGPSAPFRTHICMLLTLNHMIKRHAVAFQPHLLRVASMLLKVLDPHFPSLRESCMSASTIALRTAVKTFPMISFHQGRQRLAVGDVTQGQVVVWDMRTASKWLVWEAHSHGTSCVSFSTIGDQLATFGSRECLLKIWSTEMSMFAVLSSSHKPRNVSKFELKDSRGRLLHKPDQSPRDILSHARIVWVSLHAVELCPGCSPGQVLRMQKDERGQLLWVVRDAIVLEVAPGGPAARAGAVPGMRIVQVCGRAVESDRDIEAAITAAGPGIEVEVVQRARALQFELK
eukprot:TRINITY_DN31785_c1_g1_i2.p1 TRINITY_DN31785_c1_g1~~TRINITY_DN31785_c1_g1_i2.p1  ORF type:complete len:1379 (+),score=378.80 TRINITY_DN31785_c1_g1_i2:103-4239(+)